MKKTGGSWNPKAPPKYFSAGNANDVIDCMKGYEDILIAVNEIRSTNHVILFEQILERGHNVLVDSGIFWLTNEHKRAHGCTMDEALALPPEEIDGFGALFDRYVSIAKEYGSRCWGYIELDQGGIDNKRRTRTRLESMGLRPIPVYHPLNDGWDYFDELASGYDRICFGNIVQADAETRKRLLATAWERRRKYPKLWIHLLGMTPNPLVHAFPPSSCDSSAWLVPVLWPGGMKLRTMGQPLFTTNDFAYARIDTAHRTDENNGTKAKRLGAFDADCAGRNLRAYFDDVKRATGANLRGDK